MLNFKYPPFRLGVHDLEIERGRFRGLLLPIAEKVCKLCSLQAFESNKHFLVECLIYMKQRKRLYKKLADMHYDINEKENSEKICMATKVRKNNCIHWIGNYIYSAMKTREKALEYTT